MASTSAGWVREAYFGLLLDGHPRAVRVFDRFPRRFEEQPVLRIHVGRLTGRDAEEFRDLLRLTHGSVAGRGGEAGGLHLEQVEALYDLASHVQATMITMFLQGLRSFLMVAAYRKTSTLAQRLGTVETRIYALIPMAEQWGNIGRVERSAISDILPV